MASAPLAVSSGGIYDYFTNLDQLNVSFDDIQKQSMIDFSTLAPDFNLAPNTVISSIKNIHDSTAFSAIQFFQKMFSNFRGIDSASGFYLDAYCSILGVKRTQPSFGRVHVKINREANTNGDISIPAGFSIQYEDYDNSLAIIESPIVLKDGLAYVEAWFKLVNLGSIRPSGAYNRILTPVGKVSSITEVEEDRQVGSDRETDDNLRLKYKNIVSGKNNTLGGLVTGLTQINGVQAVYFRDNPTSKTLDDGQIPYSLQLFISYNTVVPLVKQNIQQYLAVNKGAGVSYYGIDNDTKANVTLTIGNTTASVPVIWSKVYELSVGFAIWIKIEEISTDINVVSDEDVYQAVFKGLDSFFSKDVVGSDVRNIEISSLIYQGSFANIKTGVYSINCVFGELKIGETIDILRWKEDLITSNEVRAVIASDYKITDNSGKYININTDVNDYTKPYNIFISRKNNV